MKLPGSGRSATWCALLAAIAYGLVALFVLRAVLPSPGRLLPYPELLDWNSTPKADLTRLDHRDQSMVVSVVIRNAALLTSEPWNLLDGFGQCYPMPRSYTLGEHMFGTGLLAALPYALTGDPILTYNLTLWLTLWIPGLTMYALSWAFTRNAAAAFVAGLLFELVPSRIVDPSHPYVHGDLWAPLMLLFLHRLFTVGRLSDAVLFALFLSLEVMESLYPLLACAFLVLIYGTHLAWRSRTRLVALLPKIAVASALVLATAWVVLGPYLETRATWGLLEGRSSTMLQFRDYRWGSIYFPGALVLGLAALGIVDRLRRARPLRGDDPRLAMLLCGFVLVWASTRGIPIPFTDVLVPSPIVALKPYVPGLSAVRALTAVGIVSNLAWAFLAGYGMLVLIERRGRALAIGSAAVATALALLSLYFPPFAGPMYATPSFRLAAWQASPDARDVALLRRVAEGAVLDVPFPEMEGRNSISLAQHLLLNAYDPRATAACYNSFVTPALRQVKRLAEQLPDRRASDALAALGFGTVMVEKDRLLPAALQGLLDGLRDLDNWERMRPVGRSARFFAYRLSTPTPVRTDFSLLAPAPAEPLRVERRGARVTLDVPFANRGAEIFRHPDPLVPSELVVRWRHADGRLAQEIRARELLPLAIAPGAELEVPMDLPTPEQAGTYELAIARAEEPEVVLATRTVEVVDP